MKRGEGPIESVREEVDVELLLLHLTIFGGND